jgi:hypothetical protein
MIRFLEKRDASPEVDEVSELLWIDLKYSMSYIFLLYNMILYIYFSINAN